MSDRLFLQGRQMRFDQQTHLLATRRRTVGTEGSSVLVVTNRSATSDNQQLRRYRTHCRA
tara:strand:+ start:537 stop:716 length:180 start_codon:yes stop_codon:yes gene_type:complete